MLLKMIPAALAGALCLAACGPVTAREDAPAASAAAFTLSLPAPTGAHPVGRMAGPAGGTDAWTFYPAKAGGAAARDDLPADYQATFAKRYGATVSDALTASTGHAVQDAPAAEGKFPVLVFAPGANVGARDYRALLEEVASHGYVVVALSPTSPEPPSGEQYGVVANRIIAAVRATPQLDAGGPLKGHVEGGRIGVFGHSLGGAAAVLAAAREPLILAAANLDGDYGGDSAQAQPKAPLLYILGRSPGEPADSEKAREERWTPVKAASAAPTALQMEEMRHLAMLDVAFSPQQAFPDERTRGRFGPMAGEKAMRANADLLTAFFDERLKGRAGALAAQAAQAAQAAKIAAAHPYPR